MQKNFKCKHIKFQVDLFYSVPWVILVHGMSQHIVYVGIETVSHSGYEGKFESTIYIMKQTCNITSTQGVFYLSIHNRDVCMTMTNDI